MKRFPFSILFACVFLPPICYLLTIKALEAYFDNRERSNLNDILIRDHEAVMEGRYPIREEISRNVHQYMSGSLKRKLGVVTYVMVKTRDDRILYPSHLQRNFQASSIMENLAANSPDSLDYVEVAAANFKVLNEGLVLTMDVRIEHNTWLSNSILIFYIFVSVFLFRRLIRKDITRAQRLEEAQQSDIRRLSEQLKTTKLEIEALAVREADYRKLISSLKEDKKELSRDVDGLLEEMEQLENGLENQKELKEKMEGEVLQLENQLERLRERPPRGKSSKKKTETTAKRFRSLYKNITFTKRSTDGFLSLTDELQLKAEKIILKLNDDASTVPIKRKVFGRGGKMNVLEAGFSYSGRIYFQRDSQSRVKILAIGTKNTQEEDLAYVTKNK
jgi:predicted  nucleic acid-binding Zn-ribbon protein